MRKNIAPFVAGLSLSLAYFVGAATTTGSKPSAFAAGAPAVKADVARWSTSAQRATTLRRSRDERTTRGQRAGRWLQVWGASACRACGASNAVFKRGFRNG